MKKIAQQLIIPVILLFVMQASAQEKIITGTLTSTENGSPVAGVTVTVKGTKFSTITKDDGSYRIKAPNGANTLVFSSIGYLTQETAINSSGIVNLTLAPQQKGLDEVVVVGYGTQRRRDLT